MVGTVRVRPISALQRKTCLERILFLVQRNLECFFETFSNSDLIIDDAHWIIFRGQTIQKIITELLLRIYDNQHFVILTFEDFFPYYSFISAELKEAFAKGISLHLLPPDRETRIGYCRDQAKKYGLLLPSEQIEVLVDTSGQTISSIDAALMNRKARELYSSEDVD